jgi:cell division protease FtsH
MPMPVGIAQTSRHYSDLTAQQIDALVQRLVEGMLERSLSILREKRETLEKGATALLEHETLNEDQLLALTSERVKALA